MTKQTKPPIDWIQYSNCIGCIGYTEHGTYEILLNDDHGTWDAKFRKTAIDQWGLTLHFAEKEPAVNFCQAHADKLHDAEQTWAIAELPPEYGAQEPQEVREAHLVSEQIRTAKAEIKRLQGLLESLEGCAQTAMPDDYSALEALARAATPGPWVYNKTTEDANAEIAASNGSCVADLLAGDVTRANSAFIAAFNPAAVLALIKRLRVAESQLKAAPEPAQLDIEESRQEPKVFADADVLSQFIREIDGNHKMGAGALAEKIVDRFGAQPCPAPAPKAAAFPPLDKKAISLVKCSIDVLACDEVGRCYVAYYSPDRRQWFGKKHGLSNDFYVDINIVEWHALPETGTGTPVPQTSQEIKP